MLHQWKTCDLLGFVGTQLLRRSSERGRGEGRGSVNVCPLDVIVVAPRFCGSGK